MNKYNWWEYFFKDRLRAIDELDLSYARKWNNIDWVRDKLYDDDERLGVNDKWNKTLRLLNEKAMANRYPYYRYVGNDIRMEYDYRSWNEIEFTKDEVEKELLNVFKKFPKYATYTDEGVRNDDLFQAMLAMLGFMQDVGAYYGVIRCGYVIKDDIVEAYVNSDKDRYNSIMTQVLIKQDEIFSKLYNIKNIDKDIDDILNLQDKEEIKRKIKELTLSHCKTIFEKDTESIAELQRVAREYIDSFKEENKEIIRLANVLGSKPNDTSLEDIEKMLLR
jgi:hypothetical protein|nr:MAG TPA: hypothetical protein [Caudoviricetes sp.]